MVVKRLEMAEEVAQLMLVKDDVEKYFPCTHAEWVQWLVTQVGKDRVFVWASFNDSTITSYIVVFNMINKPLSNHLFIPYVFSDLGAEDNLEVLGEIKDLAKELGTDKIMARVESIKAFEKYGFKKVAEMIQLEV